MKKIDIIGKKFGRLTVVSYSHSKGYRHYYLCKCDCGNEKIILKGNLLQGYTQSCGCLQKERASDAHSLPDGYHHLQHIYRGMVKRCYDVNDPNYKRYGARGIKICEQWLNDNNSFREWAVSHGYREDLQIERIDNDGNYCPENCKWITKYEQSLNRRSSVRITYNGKAQTLKEWSRELGINNTTLHNRINYYGWSIEKAFTTPVRPY